MLKVASSKVGGGEASGTVKASISVWGLVRKTVGRNRGMLLRECPYPPTKDYLVTVLTALFQSQFH